MILPNRKLVTALTMAATMCATSANAKSNDVIYFDNLSGPSDTVGSLKGTVKYAQHAVIPSVNRLEDEVHSSLSALRDTLVMIKPKVEIPENQTVYLFGKDKNGRTLFVRRMQNPSKLGEHINKKFFKDNGAYNYKVTSKEEVNSLVHTTNDGTLRSTKEFVNIIDNNEKTLVKITNNNYISDVRLPKTTKLHGKKVVIKNTANKPVTVHLGGHILPLEISKEDGAYVAVNQNGFWNAADKTFQKVRYGKYWSAKVPGQFIEQGMSFSFVSGKLTSSTSNVPMIGESQLMLNYLDIGFLIEPNNPSAIAKDVDLQRQYFQGLPFSRLIVSNYQPIHLKEVMMPWGELYTTASPDKANVHGGDMLGNIGSHLIARGINNSNLGVNSSRYAEGKSIKVNQLTGHSGRGVYANGIVRHGATSMGPTFTILNTVGNEFSHEAGHSLGLPHFAGGPFRFKHRGVNDVNSTWGWDKDKNQFISNFSLRHPMRTNCLENECNAPFANRLAYNSDAMAGGHPVHSQGNAYTLFTPYSANLIQQKHLQKYNFDPYSPTGFTKWNKSTQRQEPAKFEAEKPITTKEGTLTDFQQKKLIQALEQYDTVVINADKTQTNRSTIDLRLPNASQSNESKWVKIAGNTSYEIVFTTPNGSTYLAKPNSKGSDIYAVSTGTKWEVSGYAPPTIMESRVPSLQGAKVAMVHGYYDPEGKLPTYIYKEPAYGSYGMLYTHQKHRFTHDKQSCRLEVTLKNGAVSKHALHNKRLAKKAADGKEFMNKFHVNFPQSNPPVKAAVFCNGKKLDEERLVQRNKSIKLTTSIQGLTPLQQYRSIRRQKYRRAR